MRRSHGFPHPARLRPRGRSLAGFTLIELMVVVVIIGIMTAVILPEMRGTYGDAVLRSGSRELMNVCAIASSRAVSFNRLHRVHLDPSTGKFRVEQRAPGGGPAPTFVPVRGVPGCEGVLDSRILMRLRTGAGGGAGGGSGENAETDAGTMEAMAEEAAARAEAGSAPSDPMASDQSLSFYPDGTADRGEIILRDPDGFGLALRVNPITSRVRVVPLKTP